MQGFYWFYLLGSQISILLLLNVQFSLYTEKQTALSCRIDIFAKLFSTLSTSLNCILDTVWIFSTVR